MQLCYILNLYKNIMNLLLIISYNNTYAQIYIQSQKKEMEKLSFCRFLNKICLTYISVILFYVIFVAFCYKLLVLDVSISTKAIEILFLLLFFDFYGLLFYYVRISQEIIYFHILQNCERRK